MTDLHISEHPAALAWGRFAGSRSMPTAVEALEKPRNKRSRHRPVYRLSGVDSHHSSIIAKRCKRAQAEQELFIYQEILPQLPLTSPQAFGTVDGGRGKNDTWLFLEEVTGGRYLPTQKRHRQLAGRWLGILHTSAALVETARELPDQGPAHFRGDLSTIIATLGEVRTNPALGSQDVAELDAIRRQCDALVREWGDISSYCSTACPTMVQGDFKEPHIRVREDARHHLVLFDWADAGWGVPAVDLAKFIGYSVAPDLDAYLATVRPYWPHYDASTVLRMGYVGEVFRWIATVRWHVQDLRYEWVERPMSRMRLYGRWMGEILELASWRDGETLGDDWQPPTRTWY